MDYKSVPKKERNGIEARIAATVKKYGFDKFRLVVNRYINQVTEKTRLEHEIKSKELELSKLKEKI